MVEARLEAIAEQQLAQSRLAGRCTELASGIEQYEGTVRDLQLELARQQEALRIRDATLSADTEQGLRHDINALRGLAEAQVRVVHEEVESAATTTASAVSELEEGLNDFRRANSQDAPVRQREFREILEVQRKSTAEGNAAVAAQLLEELHNERQEREFR